MGPGSRYGGQLEVFCIQKKPFRPFSRHQLRARGRVIPAPMRVQGYARHQQRRARALLAFDAREKLDLDSLLDD